MSDPLDFAREEFVDAMAHYMVHHYPSDGPPDLEVLRAKARTVLEEKSPPPTEPNALAVAVYIERHGYIREAKVIRSLVTRIKDLEAKTTPGTS